MRKTFTLAAVAAAALQGCVGVGPDADHYLSAGAKARTRVPAELPVFKITALDGYESAEHPNHILIIPTNGPLFNILMTGGSPQWVAMQPQVEPVYRKAALDVLAKRGREHCELGPAVPAPDYLAIEFPYTCSPAVGSTR